MISNFPRITLIFLMLLFSAMTPIVAAAQEAAPGTISIVAEQRAAIEALTARTNEIEKQITANSEDDARLVDLRLALEDIERQLIKASVAFRPKLADLNARIDQLGPVPAEGQPPEPEIVAADRQALGAEKAQINAALGVAEDLSIRINTLIARITDMRRDLFSRLLTARYEINYALGGDVVDAARTEAQDFYRIVSSWLGFVVKFKLSSVLGAAFFALAAAAVLLIGGRRLFGRLIEADPSVEAPSYLSRLSVAFWSTLLPSAALGVFLVATYVLFDSFSVLRGDIGAMLASLFGVIGLVFFVHRLGRAILSPRLAEWRLIPVRSAAARMLLWIMSLTAVISGIDYFLSTVFGLLDSPLLLTVAEALVATVLIGLLVIGAGFVKPFTDEAGGAKPWPRSIRYLTVALGLVTVAAAILGYVGLARFISQQIVWTGAVLATMYLGFLSSRAVSEEGAFAGTAIGTRVQRWFSLDETSLDQFSLFLSILINVLVVIVGLPLILFQWGFKSGDISAWTYQIATGIKIGNFTFSLTGILWGVLVFGLGFFLTRWFQGWLDDSVMARGKVDTGVRNSIRTVIGYAGLALAALIGISAAGIDLSSLALIAGGLSLGIGFGLQNVVSNFVSGLILLAERPFKAGDWIVAGAVTGTVKKISVRATEIETFQRQTVILPNSELINSAVGNWTHRNKMGRIEVPIGVGYGSDARKVHALLLELARSHPMVLKNPEPFVLFAGFGDFSLNFEVRVFLADVMNGGIVQNDLRFAILELFEKEGIEIPFPTRDIHVVRGQPDDKWPTDDDQAEAQLVHEAAEKLKSVARAKERKRARRPDPD
jgi:potassium efflux system protein